MTEKTLTQKGSRIRRRMIDTTARILREQGFRAPRCGASPERPT